MSYRMDIRHGLLAPTFRHHMLRERCMFGNSSVRNLEPTSPLWCPMCDWGFPKRPLSGGKRTLKMLELNVSRVGG